jgi:hypothetical protein
VFLYGDPPQAIGLLEKNDHKERVMRKNAHKEGGVGNFL